MSKQSELEAFLAEFSSPEYIKTQPIGKVALLGVREGNEFAGYIHKYLKRNNIEFDV